MNYTNKPEEELKIQQDEWTLVEEPAIELFKKIGYSFYENKQLQRDPYQVFLLDVLRDKIKELNSWINENNLNKVIKEITVIQATSLLEANEQLFYKLINHISVKQDLGKGNLSQTVKIIDFDKPNKNDFRVVNQFYVKSKDFPIKPDLVAFINGIPIAIIECKSPHIEEPIDEAINQLFGYREKNESLFVPNQLLVALAKFRAEYGSTFSKAKYFFNWKTPYPFSTEQLKEKLGKSTLTEQDILLYSLFDKNNILEIIRNYTVFEEEDNNKIKKVCRYVQFIAGNKIIKRLKENKGGVIFHFQGSGKSLTMQFSALKIRRQNEIGSIKNPCIVIVTDRTDLDDQISNTFINCNFPNPISINSVEELRKELKDPKGKTIFTTIQKFLTKKGEVHPVLTDSSDVIVYNDEVQRTQYKELALNMRTALPNALFVGFTGTPIEKKDKSTTKVFGAYIDKYLPKQSIADGTTVEIKYQPRLERLHIKDSNIDILFDEHFDEYTDEEKEDIKSKYGRYKIIVEDEKRIRDIAKDILEHFNETVRPEGFKAQIVASTRQSAVTYKKILDELNAPESEVIISKNPKDSIKSELRNHYKTKSQQRAIIKRFRNKDDPLSLLIVCDMLLTGFDAPIEQVMYLDKPLKEHTLMQAVARVNRPYTENKTHGLIIAYCNIASKLKEALAMFNDGDISGFLTPVIDDVARAEQSLAKVKRFFSNIPNSYSSDKYVEACVLESLSSRDQRIRFEKAFKEFVIYVNNIMPNKEANQFKKDLFFYGKIYNDMRLNYDIKKRSILDVSEKIKNLIYEHLKTEGVIVLHDPISIYSADFNELVNKKKSDSAKASMMEHKIRTTITNLMPTNPVYFTSLRERLEKVISEHEKDILNVTSLLVELNDLKDDLDVSKIAKKHNMKEEEYAIYQLLRNIYIKFDAEKEQKVHLKDEDVKVLEEASKELFADLQELAVIDWKHKTEHQKIMKKKIKRNLYKLNFDVNTAEKISGEILNLLMNLL